MEKCVGYGLVRGRSGPVAMFDEAFGVKHPVLLENDRGRGERQSPRVVLYQPEIPQNTGNVARTCAATHTPLHLVEPLGFKISDRHLKRAGLDYWPHVDLKIHANLDDLRRETAGERWVCFSARGELSFHDFDFMPGDCLVFGPETRGLPESVLKSSGGTVLRVPMDRGRVRSLNLATTVGVVLYEAIRQLALRGHAGFLMAGP